GGGATGSTNRYDEIHFRKSNNEIAFRIRFKMLEGGWVSGDRGDVAYWNGAGWIEFADGEDLTWYRNRIDFDCTSGKYSWYIYDTDGSILGSITNIDFENTMATLDEILFTSHLSTYRGTTYFDAFGFTWEGYNIGDNRFDDTPAVLNFEIDSQLDSSSGDITSVSLDYSYKNMDNKQVSLKIFNFAQQNWDTVINSAIYSSFTPQTYVIGSDYYDQNYNLKFKFEGDASSSSYEFYLDQFKINYNYVPTGGNIYADITKTIADPFLNRYSGFANYQELFDIIISFTYSLSPNNPSYANFARFYIGTTEYSLPQAQSTFISPTFEFDSASPTVIKFEVSNADLVLSDMNYDMQFKCINTSGNVVLQQSFLVEFPEAGLTQFEKDNGKWFIDTTYAFTAISDGITYYNTYGETDKLQLRLNIEADGSW
ncbi:hypothetical protein LCGC14_2733000, partial [marine sediment metagenome]